MTGADDFCLRCIRNKIRRHWPEMSGGAAGTGLAVMIAAWHAPGAAGSAAWGSGYLAAVSGLAVMAVMLLRQEAAHDPRKPRRKIRQQLRSFWRSLLATSLLTSCGYVLAFVLGVPGGWCR
jgi:hypothetical protein